MPKYFRRCRTIEFANKGKKLIHLNIEGASLIVVS
jgi:hypothetical protein